MKQVMTVLEDRVPVERLSQLVDMSQRGMPPPTRQIVRGYIVRSQSEPTLWRGISIWRSVEALEESTASLR